MHPKTLSCFLLISSYILALVPGFIAQHDHPLLAALTMTSEIISIEDWVLPKGTSKAAKNHEEYLARLKAANTALKDPDAPLISWGYTNTSMVH